MAGKFKPSDLKAKEVLKSVIAQELEKISKLDSPTKEKKNNDLRDLIKYYFDLNNTIEEKSTRACNFSLQFLVVCAVAAGILVFHWHKIDPLAFTIALSFLSIQILYLLLIVVAYESESRLKDSLFYGIGQDKDDKANWFYYKRRSILKLITRAVFYPKKSADEPRPYLEGLRSFTRNYWEENIDEKITNNMEQLYLLQAQNLHFNRLYQRLKKLRFWSIITSILSVFIILPGFYVYINL